MAKHPFDIRVISIGALARNPLWPDRQPAAQRSGHATTSLIRSGGRTILVDPGLPAPVVAARLAERSGLEPKDVTHVMLTSFRPEVCRGIVAFEHATWWVSHAERETIGVALVERLQQMTEVLDADDEDDSDGEDSETRGRGRGGTADMKAALELDIAILRRCEPAPDHLADNIDLFPLPGVTPGLSGILAATPSGGPTILVCGDAIPTIEHLERGMVLPTAADIAKARESFAEAVEIADHLILGRDNMVPNPVRRKF